MRDGAVHGNSSPNHSKGKRTQDPEHSIGVLFIPNRLEMGKHLTAAGIKAGRVLSVMVRNQSEVGVGEDSLPSLHGFENHLEMSMKQATFAGLAGKID